MFTFLRELFDMVVVFTVGMIVFFGIPGLVLALLAIVFGVPPQTGGWYLLLILVGVVWIFMLMNPPSWLKRIVNWLEK